MPPTPDAKLDQILAQNAQILAQQTEQGTSIKRLTSLIDGNPDLGYVGMRERMKTVEAKVDDLDGKIDTVTQDIKTERDAIKNRMIGVAVGAGLGAGGGLFGLLKLLELLVGVKP